MKSVFISQQLALNSKLRGTGHKGCKFDLFVQFLWLACSCINYGGCIINSLWKYQGQCVAYLTTLEISPLNHRRHTMAESRSILNGHILLLISYFCHWSTTWMVCIYFNTFNGHLCSTALYVICKIYEDFVYFCLSFRGDHQQHVVFLRVDEALEQYQRISIYIWKNSTGQTPNC